MQYSGTAVLCDRHTTQVSISSVPHAKCNCFLGVTWEKWVSGTTRNKLHASVLHSTKNVFVQCAWIEMKVKMESWSKFVFMGMNAMIIRAPMDAKEMGTPKGVGFCMSC